MSSSTTSGKNLRDLERLHAGVRHACVVAPEPHDPHQAIGGLNVIIDHQDAQRSPLDLGRFEPWLGFLRDRHVEPWQADDELATLPYTRAGGGHTPAVHHDQAPHQGQTDAQPALATVQGAIGLGEQVEDARQQIRVDPDAVIPHLDDELTPVSFGRQ